MIKFFLYPIFKVRIFIINFYNKILLSNYKVNYGINLKINGRIYIKSLGNLKIGDNCIINSSKNINPIGGDIISRLIVQENAMLHIGNNVGISNSTIYCVNKITIEDNVWIGGGCKIWDSDFHSIDPNIRLFQNDSNINTKPINIKERAFIGGLSIILKGVTIGKNSVVGAGSVVTKDIPENEIWAGNPAKFIRKLK